MLFNKKDLIEVNQDIDQVLKAIHIYEHKHQHLIDAVHPNYTKSAKNLVHYLALRSFDTDHFQQRLKDIGIPSVTSIEDNVLHNVLTFKSIITHLLNENGKLKHNTFMSVEEVKEIISKNTDALFGKKTHKRNTRILVTQPTIAAEDSEFAKLLFENGMDCARVNCAHDDPEVWKKIIDNLKEHRTDCKVLMDLGGPKLRTGKMQDGPKVIHVKPQRNNLGQVVKPAKLWLAPYGVHPPKEMIDIDAVIPVNAKWLKKTRKGSFIIFRDARNKRCKIKIVEKSNPGRIAECKDSAFITTGMELDVFFENKSKSEIHSVHELLPLNEVVIVKKGDLMRLDKEPILGAPALYHPDGSLREMAHISCTLPEIFDYVEPGEEIYFDDGVVEGLIHEVNDDHLIILITNTKKSGGKIKADKGINLPQSKLGVKGLTAKDRKDLEFVVEHATAVNFSFVNTKEDVQDLFDEFKRLGKETGIVFKIETQQSFKNLPSIILKGMQTYPIGVMIARGDLAIETGWKNFTMIQEEILRLCHAAHIPDIWATQVLENLTKKGVPTRAELTDSAFAQRAECVMLNKGPYIEKSVKMLDKVIRRMERIQSKNLSLLPKLQFAEEL